MLDKKSQVLDCEMYLKYLILSSGIKKEINRGLVTIAIPAYKRTWLSQTIESALNQDYHNIEVVIVDAHSPQNLKEIVYPYLCDERVKYCYKEENLG